MGNSMNPSSTRTSQLTAGPSSPSEIEINGKPVTRDVVKDWLLSKKTTLWSDWCVSDPSRMELAVDWFMTEMNAVSVFA